MRRSFLGAMAGLVFLTVALPGCESDPDPSDTGPSTEETAERQVGLRHYSGTATVADTYVGQEAFHFTDDRGLGEDLCRIRYDLVSIQERIDCADCLWAFDLEVSGATVEPRGDEGCLSLGIDAADFEGANYSYGFAQTSGGYEEVLMYQVGSYGWYPVTWASWEEPSFSYDWPMDYYYF